jgi:hypothetical protein
MPPGTQPCGASEGLVCKASSTLVTGCFREEPLAHSGVARRSPSNKNLKEAPRAPEDPALLSLPEHGSGGVSLSARRWLHRQELAAGIGTRDAAIASVLHYFCAGEVDSRRRRLSKKRRRTETVSVRLTPL